MRLGFRGSQWEIRDLVGRAKKGQGIDAMGEVFFNIQLHSFKFNLPIKNYNVEWFTLYWIHMSVFNLANGLLIAIPCSWSQVGSRHDKILQNQTNNKIILNPYNILTFFTLVPFCLTFLVFLFIPVWLSFYNTN